MEELEYFQMVERNTVDVSITWKAYHVITLMMAAVSGLVTEIYFCRILNAFSNNCVLHAKLFFRSPNDTVISTIGTKWGSDGSCRFCSATWMGSFLVGVILSVLFLACSKGGRGYVNNPFSRPWTLICPVLFISTVMFVNAAIATSMTIGGLKKFCAEFETKLKTKECTNAIDMFAVDFPNKTYAIATSIFIVKKSAVLMTFAWILFAFVTLMRVFFAPDFSLLLVKVKKVSHK